MARTTAAIGSSGGFYDRFWSEKQLNLAERMKQATRLAVLSRLIGSRSQCERTLVVGCGAGDELHLVSNSLVGLDISGAAIREAKRRFPEAILIVSDAQAIPFSDNVFDCVICSEVLEHLPAPESCVAEMARVLVPGGRCVVSVPNWCSSWGLARKAAEALLRIPMTAANQPIDNWFTASRLWELLSAHLEVVETAGAWYAPPLGRGRWHVPDIISAALLVPLKPLERVLQRTAPCWGHVVAALAVKRCANGPATHAS